MVNSRRKDQEKGTRREKKRFGSGCTKLRWAGWNGSEEGRGKVVFQNCLGALPHTADFKKGKRP